MWILLPALQSLPPLFGERLDGKVWRLPCELTFGRVELLTSKMHSPLIWPAFARLSRCRFCGPPMHQTLWPRRTVRCFLQFDARPQDLHPLFLEFALLMPIWLLPAAMKYRHLMAKTVSDRCRRKTATAVLQYWLRRTSRRGRCLSNRLTANCVSIFAGWCGSIKSGINGRVAGNGAAVSTC